MSSLEDLRSHVAGLLHLDFGAVATDIPLLEIGADSLVIVEMIRHVESTYGLKLTVRQLFEEFVTLHALSSYIDEHAPARAKKIPPGQTSTRAPAGAAREDLRPVGAPAPAAADGQQDLQARLQELLAQVRGLVDAQPVKAPPAARAATSKPFRAEGGAGRVAFSEPAPRRAGGKPASRWSRAPTNGREEPSLGRNSAGRPWRARARGGARLTVQQERYLADFLRRYGAHVGRSREAALRHGRSVCGNRQWWPSLEPELQVASHPVYAERSRGSHLWDLDGNEYVDIAMGFGCHLFGHGPRFLTGALEDQLGRGANAVGPVNPYTAEVADLVAELTGAERVTFCNTGTEAVMTALRLARTATSRRKVAMFQGSYHGHSDGTLAVPRAGGAGEQAVPLSAGTPAGMVEDVLVLPYGEEQSLSVLAAHADELAAVLVEPVQCLHPELQPREFLHDLRRLTREAGVVLIFDEYLTGFRVHPGGAQAWFDVEADLALYGGVVADGLPVGILAGAAAVLDRVDGGWRQPGGPPREEVEMTYTAGTYCRNPLSMVAARAVLQEIRRTGSDMQEELNQRTAELAEVLNDTFDDLGFGARVGHFGSFFRFAGTAAPRPGEQLALQLFLLGLRTRGVYVLPDGACFLSTAHGDEDLNHIVDAAEDTARELASGGVATTAWTG